MSKELFIKLSEELGRDPTDDEMADEMSKSIDNAGEFVVLPRDKAMKNFRTLMNFQYGNPEESEKAWNKLKEEERAIDEMVREKKQIYGDGMRDASVVSDALKSLRKVRGQ